MVHLLVMEPKQWIERPYCWSRHMAVAASTPIMNHIMDVLKRGILSRQSTDIGFFGCECLKRRNEKHTVKPVPYGSREVSPGYPFPRLKIFLDTIVILNPSNVVVNQVGVILFGIIFVGMATCSFGAVVLSSIRLGHAGNRREQSHRLSRDSIRPQLWVTHGHAFWHTKLPEWVPDL